MRLAICVATMREGKLPGEIVTWKQESTYWPPMEVYEQHNTKENNLGVVGSYQELYKQSKEEVLVFAHDDVTMRERGWNERVLKEFEDERVAVAGFGGAEWHGTDDLYKRPYQLSNLRRGGYGSNVDDAEQHGERFTGAKDVAVLDGFALIIRRSFLDRIGGWKILIDAGIDFIAYDYVICALARRYGYKIRLIGVRCHHIGGGTSVKMNVDRQAEYDRSHRWCYENLRDVLPCRIKD